MRKVQSEAAKMRMRRLEMALELEKLSSEATVASVAFATLLLSNFEIYTLLLPTGISQCSSLASQPNLTSTELFIVRRKKEKQKKSRHFHFHFHLQADILKCS